MARRWLRLDAAYCAAAGVIAISLSGPLARLFDVRATVVVALGVATVAWALVLLAVSAAERLYHPLALVAAANVLAAAAIASLSATAPAVAARLLLAAVAVEVGAFAAVQLRILRRSADLRR